MRTPSPPIGRSSVCVNSRALLPALILTGIVSVGIGLTQGSVDLSLTDIHAALLGHHRPSLQHTLIMDIRLPRVLLALVTGALLAVAGVLMQVLLRNPLADPYLLGVSGGAAVAALSAMLLGLGSTLVNTSAFGGALLATLLVFVIAHGHGGWTPTRLLLTGVVLASGWGAMISFLLATSPNTHIHGLLYWLLGDLSGNHSVLPASLLLLLALIASLPIARHLNVMVQGDDQARSLGVDVNRLRLLLLTIAALLTATAVTLAGTIGFIGLVVPHMLRMTGLHDHRLLIPASALLGGILLVLADTLARTLLLPAELPVGIFTAVLGIPLFLFLLYRSRLA